MKRTVRPPRRPILITRIMTLLLASAGVGAHAQTTPTLTATNDQLWGTGAGTVSTGGVGASGTSPNNTAIGINAGDAVSSSLGFNVAIGAGAGNTISANSNYSLAIGDDAGTGVTGGNANQAIGYHAGININGGYNQTEGDAAGQNITGSYNNSYGWNAGSGVTGSQN